MDFGTIRSRLNKQNFNHYQTIEDFVSDVKLVFANCATFNPVSLCIDLYQHISLFKAVNKQILLLYF